MDVVGPEMGGQKDVVRNIGSEYKEGIWSNPGEYVPRLGDLIRAALGKKVKELTMMGPHYRFAYFTWVVFREIDANNSLYRFPFDVAREIDDSRAGWTVTEKDGWIHIRVNFAGSDGEKEYVNVSWNEEEGLFHMRVSDGEGSLECLVLDNKTGAGRVKELLRYLFETDEEVGYNISLDVITVYISDERVEFRKPTTSEEGGFVEGGKEYTIFMSENNDNDKDPGELSFDVVSKETG